MAKGICTLLAWGTEPEHDDRKKMGMKIVIIWTGLTASSGLLLNLERLFTSKFVLLALLVLY